MSNSVTYGIGGPPTVDGLPRGMTDREYQKFVESPEGSGKVAIAVAERGTPLPGTTEALLVDLITEVRALRRGLGFALDPAGGDVSTLLEETPTE